MGEYVSDPEVKAAIKSLNRKKWELDPLIKMLVVGIFIGLIAGQLAWDRPEKQPDYIMASGDRVIVVIQKFNKTAYIFTRHKEDQHFEFETELKPKSTYYPLPERESAGRTLYSKNPKFDEWVQDWKKFNKVD
jgi:hypothetical protein